MADYEYDVFFSYKRHDLVAAWVENVVTRLTFYLTNELGGNEARVFFDRDSIEVGDHWPDRIREALASSRSMVAVWSPAYFKSPWCSSEWKSFLERERVVGLQEHGLVAPIKYADGKWFPPAAQKVQYLDLSDYTSTVAAFWDSDRAVELDRKLQEFAPKLASVVNGAPEFQEWPIVDAPNVATSTLSRRILL